MSCHVLDINDATLALWRAGERLLESPGYALLDGRNYSFGEAARGQARLHPQQINHRFWSQLDMDPIVPAFGPARHSADLVHSHLQSIHEQADAPEELVLAAPASLQHDQLALLLGIIEACPFAAVGLVDRAVAALATTGADTFNWHVDLQLHQALVTGLRFDGEQVHQDRVTPIPGSGWLALQEAMAKAIADAFIRQTRFDPRRKAATEQALYDQLPALLTQLQSASEHNLELGGHRARIERSLLAEQCANHYQRIARATSEQAGQIVLGPALTALPGIESALPGATLAEASAIANSVEQHKERICDGDGLHFVTSLPSTASATAAAPKAITPEPAAQETTEEPPEKTEPGHSQIDIRGGSLTLRHLSGPAPSINGTLANGDQPLQSGDTVELEDGSRWRLIREPTTAGGDDGT